MQGGEPRRRSEGPGVAVIGCGAWGRNHIRVWTRLKCLRAVCDSDPSRLEPVTREGGIEAFRDVDRMLGRPEIGAVVVATPAATHVDIASRALRAGKHVLVEKPIALDVPSCEALIGLANETGLTLMAGHVLEFHPAALKLRELVSAGALGKVCYVSSNRLNLGKIRTEENALWSFAPHDVSLAIRLLGRLPEEVACHGGAYLSHEVADVTLTNLRFPGNIRGHIFVSWLHPFKEQRFVVVGDRQMAVFDDTLEWDRKLLLYAHSVEWIDGMVPVARKAKETTVDLKPVEPLLAECEHFLECVQTGRRPLTDGESGLRALLVLQAAQRSLQEGGKPQKVRPAPGGVAGFWSHPTATVDGGAKIGEGTKIWHFSHVMRKARIGRNCVLGQNVFVADNVLIGDGVKIQNNVSVYEGVEIEDGAFCGPSMVFTNVVNPRSAIERKSEFKRTLVRAGATIGANATLVCGITIGRFAFVGAGAVVTRDIPDYALATGVPAKTTGWVCRCGVKLPLKIGTSEAEACCPACGIGYALSGLRLRELEARERETAE